MTRPVLRRPRIVSIRGLLAISLLPSLVLFVNNVAVYQKLTEDEARTSAQVASTSPTKRKSINCAHRRSVEDVRHCFTNYVRPLPPDCDIIDDWESVQRCLSGRSTPRPADSYQIHILGERNSGTKFIMQELARCFNTLPGIKVHRDFLRSKHFFQTITKGDFSKSLIVPIFRDPFEWTAAMREAPYHSPHHVAAMGSGTIQPLPWKVFVERAWAMKRTPDDLEYIQKGDTKRRDLCVQSFNLNEVVPCIYNISDVGVPEDMERGYSPIYELRRDNSGQPFANIMELRTDKIVNFLLEIPLIMQPGGFVPVRYEDLLRQGTQFVIDQVAEVIGRAPVADCQGTPPQPERLGRRALEAGFREWIDQHVDPQVEGLLGYR